MDSNPATNFTITHKELEKTKRVAMMEIKNAASFKNFAVKVKLSPSPIFHNYYKQPRSILLYYNITMTILITGTHGLLGGKLKKHFSQPLCPSRFEMDIRVPPDMWDIGCNLAKNDIHTVIHCAAVKTIACDADPFEAMRTNILGTVHIATFCHLQQAKMIYISTDYVFKGDRGDYSPDDEVLPQNYYAETKLAGEYAVKCLPEYLIVRLSFFPDEFPYKEAFVDQWTTRITVSEAAEQIASLVKKGATGIHHICGPKRTVYEYALATSGGKGVRPIKLADHNFKRPKDTSLIQCER